MIIQVALMVFIKKTTNGLSFWMQRRNEEGHPLHNLWEFPGGKIRSKETAQEASHREIREEVGIEFDQLTQFRFYHCEYEDKSYCLHVCLGSSERLPVSGGQKWFSLGHGEKSYSLKNKIPQVNHLIVDDIFQYVEQGGVF